jgi:YlmC/YmxH family sporulation protein
LKKGLIFLVTFLGQTEYNYDSNYKAGAAQIAYEGVNNVIKTSDLRQREVINMVDGKRLGFVSDLDIDLEEGRVKSIIIPAQGKFFSLFARSGDYVIPWEQIKKIGSDVILVELKEFINPKKNENKL